MTSPRGSGATRRDAPTHLVLLRGVNVGGKNSLPMVAFSALLRDAGAIEVRTYLQSGNALVRVTSAVARTLQAELTGLIAERNGLSIPAMLFTASELREAAAAHPLAPKDADPRTLHVAFLAAEPATGAGRLLDPARSPPDRFTLRGRLLYLSLPNGVGRTRFTSDYLDRALGTVCTIRNWRTVRALAALAGGA